MISDWLDRQHAAVAVLVIAATGAAITVLFVGGVMGMVALFGLDEQSTTCTVTVPTGSLAQTVCTTTTP